MNPTGILERLAQIEHRCDIARQEFRELMKQVARISDDVAQLKRHLEEHESSSVTGGGSGATRPTFADELRGSRPKLRVEEGGKRQPVSK